ncbi:EntF [Commensalibacter communis]|uniref:non-ribosomal peptide synthetase n=1 Tax=Commensalibacter communis TaxID=2972786 RepID=UPI0022FFBE37|nr:non-ribosomal peptide synthetase [Commensalibacter communis]CAI3955410.1 EntF [Commensalibacter communis]
MIDNFISELKLSGIELWEDNGQLRYRAPAGMLSESQLAKLREKKKDILDYLIKQNNTLIETDVAGRYEPFPLTDLQSAYLLGRNQGFELGGVACHGYLEFEFQTLNVEKLESAWHDLIYTHDMLRAIIHSNGSQSILPKVPPYKIEVVDVRGKPRGVEVEAVEKFRLLLSHRNASPDQWPLIELKVTLGDTHAFLHASINLLVCDFQSARLLLQELSRKYFEQSTSPAPQISFRDYVLAQRRMTESQKYRNDKQYWFNQLDDFPMPPTLPLTGNVIGSTFSRKTFILNQSEVNVLSQLAANYGVGLSSTILTIYAEIIGRWSAQTHFGLSLTTMQRTMIHPDINKVIGDFSSVELLNVHLISDCSFAEQVALLQEQLWSDLDHADFSGIEVLRELTRRRGREASLYPIAFTSSLSTGSDTLTSLFPGARLAYGITQTPQIIIDCQVGPSEDGLVINWDIRDGVIADYIVSDMFHTFKKFVRNIASDEQYWNKPINIEIPDEQSQRRSKVNSILRPLSNHLLHQDFFERAKEYPEKIALVDAYNQLTYKQLTLKIDRLAAKLMETGMQPGELVAVIIDKNIAQIIAVFAVLRAGGVYLPINISQPPARRNAIIQSAKVPRVLVADDRLVQELHGVTNHIINVTDILLDEKPQQFSIPERKPSDLAYIIFTSGSTGLPKGVMITHEAAKNTIDDINERFDVGHQDRILGLASFDFDLSVYDIFGVLGVGGTLILPEASRRSNPAYLANLVEKWQITLWNSVPALLDILTEYLQGASTNIALSSLRVALLSGDWIPISLPERIRSFIPDLRIISLGGATEAGIWSIYYPIKDVPENWKSIPYGKPLSNQSFDILDASFRSCPDYVVGEIYIGGKGLALGYLNDPEKTAERFIYHPVTKERLYRTGDFGRYLSDGNIEFLGRQDLQVKIRGHRIEISEIEAALEKHPDIGGAAVVVLGESNHDRRLVGFIKSKIVETKDQSISQIKPATQNIIQNLTINMDLAKVKELAVTLEKVSLYSMARMICRGNSIKKLGKFEDIIHNCQVSERNIFLLQRWLNVLVKEGLFGLDDSGHYYCQDHVDHHSVDLLWFRIKELNQEIKWGDDVLNYIELSHNNLDGLMRDEIDPLHLLFPEGKTEVADGAYRNNLVSQIMNGAVCALVDQIISFNDGPTRLLEVGAGVGGTSMDLIPTLNNRDVEYLFTDVSQYFLNEAEKKLNQFPWVKYGLFDINTDHVPQGIEPNSCHIILCANVLHNSQHALNVLKRLREILVPGGWLIFIEATKDNYQIMTSMEFKEGLTGFTDCRVEHQTTFLTTEQWEHYLKEAGATEFVRIPAGHDVFPDLGQHVFAARFKSDRKSISLAEVKQHAKTYLPDYMIPSDIHILDEMPLTTNAKIDRTALAKLAVNQHQQHKTVGEKPKSELEKQIAEIWSSLLKVNDIGTDQSFFELGGDSLLIAQVIARLRDKIPAASKVEWDILLRQLLNEPTISALAALLEKNQQNIEDSNQIQFIELKRGSKKPILLFVHDGSGTLAPYLNLLEKIKDDQSVIGLALTTPNALLMKEPQTAISTLADEFVELLEKNIQKGETLHIVGYCLGGLLATEIARRLPAIGIYIEQLSIISSYRVPFIIEDDLLAEYVFARVMQANLFEIGYPQDELGMQMLIQSILDKNPQKIPENALLQAAQLSSGEIKKSILALAQKSQQERLEAIQNNMRHSGTEFSDIQRITSQYKLIKGSLAAVASHHTEPYDGKMIFVRQTGEIQFLPKMNDEMSNYWTAVCSKGLNIIDVPGDHFSCMSSLYVASIAQALGLQIKEKK